jgi:hypothetical protein
MIKYLVFPFALFSLFTAVVPVISLADDATIIPIFNARGGVFDLDLPSSWLGFSFDYTVAKLSGVVMSSPAGTKITEGGTYVFSDFQNANISIEGKDNLRLSLVKDYTSFVPRIFSIPKRLIYEFVIADDLSVGLDEQFRIMHDYKDWLAKRERCVRSITDSYQDSLHFPLEESLENKIISHCQDLQETAARVQAELNAALNEFAKHSEFSLAASVGHMEKQSDADANKKQCLKWILDKVKQLHNNSALLGTIVPKPEEC